MREDASDQADGPHAGHWVGATHWSWIASASEGDSTQASAALEKLCEMYWFPLYAYIRRKGYGPDEAQDLTQEFFARFLQSQILARADRRKGKFRSFLLASMEHFLTNEWRRSQAAKRCPAGVIRLDDAAENRYALEPSSDLTPERLYERQWALNLFETALLRLREQYAKDGRVGLYEGLKQFLSTEPREGDYAGIGDRLSMSVAAVSTAVHRLRHRYRELVRDEIARTVSSQDELEEEIRSLLTALG
jgi:RNA polymerase sigma factor (sigma-70 family)